MHVSNTLVISLQAAQRHFKPASKHESSCIPLAYMSPTGYARRPSALGQLVSHATILPTHPTSWRALTVSQV